MQDLDDIKFIIYNTTSWNTIFIMWKKENDSIVIMGVMETNCQQNGWEVFRVAAEDGYGPWLYIMALSTHDRLSPNQNGIEDVSVEASEVWEYFFNQGLDSEEIPDSVHEYEWLRRSYNCDCNVVDYEDDLTSAALRGSFISDDEFDEIKQKAEEYLDLSLEKVYG